MQKSADGVWDVHEVDIDKDDKVDAYEVDVDDRRDVKGVGNVMQMKWEVEVGGCFWKKHITGFVAEKTLVANTMENMRFEVKRANTVPVDMAASRLHNAENSIKQQGNLTLKSTSQNGVNFCRKTQSSHPF